MQTNCINMTIRMTKKRQAILDVLQRHHGTHSAAQIHAALPDIDLVTIYRSLELFTREKMVKQFHLDGKEAVYEYQHEPHHHAICRECERVIHFTAPDAEIKRLLGIEDFEVDELEVTVRGRCRH
jgi:Fe2+ or Zn2+ uptake regulation protein